MPRGSLKLPREESDPAFELTESGYRSNLAFTLSCTKDEVG